jgi:cation:H+ antiporter
VPRGRRRRTRRASRRRTEEGHTVDVIGIVPALAAVVIGSIVVVNSATALGTRWHVPHTILGILVLAALTGIPNLVGAIQLARRGRGNAVVSEALNSNSLNVLFGLCLPAALLGASRMGTVATVALGWLIGMTVLALFLVSRGDGLHKRGGAVLVATYAAFVVAVVVL